MSEPTWAEVAAMYPSAAQQYVQQVGPLPDGPITEEAWGRFREWCAANPTTADEKGAGR